MIFHKDLVFVTAVFNAGGRTSNANRWSEEYKKRRDELLGLRWEDIDFDNRTISVKQTVQRSGGNDATGEGSKLHIVTPKSARSVRTLPLPEFVAEAILGRKARQAQERLLAGSRWRDSHLVFTNSKGTPIEPRRLDTEFKRILKEAEQPETIRLHDSRHFAASLLAALDVHPRIAMEILGHSDINLTMKTYTHVPSDDMREAANKIDAALGSNLPISNFRCLSIWLSKRPMTPQVM